MHISAAARVRGKGAVRDRVCRSGRALCFEREGGGNLVSSTKPGNIWRGRQIWEKNHTTRAQKIQF